MFEPDTDTDIDNEEPSCGRCGQTLTILLIEQNGEARIQARCEKCAKAGHNCGHCGNSVFILKFNRELEFQTTCSQCGTDGPVHRG